MASKLVSRDGNCTAYKILDFDRVHEDEPLLGQRDSSRLVFVCSFVTGLGTSVFGLVQTAVLTSYIDEEIDRYM
jgi:hypothetical protein